MRAGKLKHRVKYIYFNDVPDDSGGYERVWKTFCKRWCEIRTGTVTSGAAHETVNSDKVQPVKDFIIRHRFTEGLTEDMRVEYKNKLLEVVGILYPDNNNVYMDVIVREVGLNAS